MGLPRFEEGDTSELRIEFIRVIASVAHLSNRGEQVTFDKRLASPPNSTQPEEMREMYRGTGQYVFFTAKIASEMASV